MVLRLTLSLLQSNLSDDDEREKVGDEGKEEEADEYRGCRTRGSCRGTVGRRRYHSMGLRA